MGEVANVDICVIGAGSGGLVVAAGASQMGARTMLIERGRMGGDCLNYGCVPSKALIAAAERAHAFRTSGPFGIAAVEPAVDFPAVMDHVRRVIAEIEPKDSEERFTALGVRVLRETARFTGSRELEAGDLVVRARRFVIATGSSPVIPSISGLADVPFFTNETIFDNGTLPGRLIVIGGGPIGCELAQAHRRLGADVTVIQRGGILPKDDPELTEVVRTRLRAEGVELAEGATVTRVERTEAGGIAVMLATSDGERRIEGSHLLVATGRVPTVDGLGLEAAGVAFGQDGIAVDARLRTSNRHIFAIGDVAAGGPRFTHMASHHAGIVLRNALFRWPAKAERTAVPRVTYTDPELAHVGLDEAAARAAGTRFNVLRAAFAENDRASAGRTRDGFVKVITSPRGRVLGASIVGAHAGELILPWVLAVGRGLGIGAMAGLIVPYPTLSEASKSAAGSFFVPKLFTARTRRLVRLLAKLG